MQKVICFGEVLWDLLPSGPLPGGAPMNVAIHLNNLGIKSQIISRVGQDEWGDHLVQMLKTKGVDNSLIQLDHDYQTGVVEVDLTDPTNVEYTIKEPVAWDFITSNLRTKEAVRNATGMVYGSLACRNETSYQTILELLKLSKLRIFDVNLRKPHYTKEKLETLITLASIVKLNEEELYEITSWYGQFIGLQSQVRFFQHHFELDVVCVTRGSKGAALLYENNYLEQEAYKVKVQDTIGSGDAFLAAFISMFLREKEPSEILNYACAVGALVASHRGANPVIEAQQIQALMTN